ncbi:MAG: glycosyltransferase family 4 protein [Patescibacteria group bacterium]|nr:glycosyltransferase family 4 protein [Patescibacteria group bacterium]
MKNILLINSAKKFEQSLLDMFGDLGKDNSFFSWVGDRDYWQQFNAAGKLKKIFFGPELKNFFGVASFLSLLPFLWLGYLWLLSSWKRSEQIDKILCVDLREKIIFTPLARILRIKVYWLELPERNRRQLKKMRRLFSSPAKLIVFTPQDAEDLAKDGFKKEKIHNISLGVNLQSVERQDNLFSSLAKADKPYSFYKNFTVGAWCGSGDRRRLEILLQSAKACVNLIPNFRLVVIGQDTSSGNLNWLIKKLGLERRVWLVGEQKNLIQWFADLDLYVVLAENPGLNDLERALMAASRGLPLLGFPTRNLTDIIIEGQNGFICEDDRAEALAQKIIAIEADERARKKMGANGQQLVYRNFDRQKQLQRLREIIG